MDKLFFLKSDICQGGNTMRPFGALISYHEAKEIIDAIIQPIIHAQAVPIDAAVNRRTC